MSSKDCHVEFIAPSTQEYQVIVWNRLVYSNSPSDRRNGPKAVY
jgi:hypothetical protein